MGYIVHLVGTSGSGKSTVHKLLPQELEKEGYVVTSVSEPGPLRQYTKQYRQQASSDRDPMAETILFTADRLIQYMNLVTPHKDDDSHIALFDRGLPDTVVYQGILGGVNIQKILELNSLIPHSDLYLCLLVDGDEGERRARMRMQKTHEPLGPGDRAQAINTLREAYLELPRYFPHVQFIDTTFQTEQEVFDECLEKILQGLK